MRVKIIFLWFFLGFQAVFLPQTGSPGSRTSGNSVLSGNQDIATSYTRTACGLNYTYASNPLFGRTGNNFTLSVLQPATFSISGIPTCGIIEKALLYIGTAGTGTLIQASITNPLSANSIFPMTIIGTGPDKNWGFGGSYTYLADVTPIIAGNGTYVLSGIPTGSLLSGDDANGALLLVIYSDRTQNYSGSIVIGDGSFVNNAPGGAITTTLTGFDVCGTPTLTSNFMLLDDLQQYDSTYVSLNDALPNFLQGPASDVPWEFITAPGTAVSPGQTSAAFGVRNVNDTIGLLMTGFYFQSDCPVCGPMNLMASGTPSCLATATVAVSGGVAPYTYLWSGTTQTTSIVTGLSAGTETVTVSDALGCLTGSTTVTVSTPAPPLSVTSGSVCAGFGTTLSAGPTGSYTWSPSASLDNPSSQTVTANPMSTTVYTIDYTDPLGCLGTTTTQVVVTFTQAFALSNTTTCSGKDLNLSTGTFTGDGYAWTGPLAFSSALQNPLISNATTGMAGVYNVSVTSIPGCTSTAFYNVTINPAPPITVSSGSTCIGFGLSVNAGSAASYTWSPGGTLDNPNAQTVTATPLATTIYTIDFTDASGCTGTSTTQVEVTYTQTFALSNTTTCSGKDINLSTGAFTGDGYVWTGPATFSSTLQNPLIPNATTSLAGVYNVSVTSIPGCTSTAFYNVTINPAPPIAVSSGSTCIGFGLSVNAGSAATYTWSPGGSLDNPSAQNVIATPLATTIYTVDFTDPSGCTGTSTTQVIVTYTQAISGNSSTLCASQTITLSTNGFTGNAYIWKGPGTYSSSLQNPNRSSATTTMSGAYNLSVTSIPGCTSIAVSDVTVFATPSTSITTNAPICSGFNLTLNGSGGAGASYDWTGPAPNNFLSTSQNNTIPSAGTSDSGTYTLTATFAASGCFSTVTKPIVIQPLPVPSINTTTNVCVGRVVTFSASPSGFPVYQWSGPAGFTSTLQVPSIASVSLANNGTYVLTVKDANNCQASATTTLAAIVNPTVSATGTTVCFGSPATLTANGAGFFTWLGPAGYNTTPVIPQTFIPVVNNLTAGTYTVILTSATTACSAQATTMLATIPVPTIVATGTDVCLNEPATLTVTGAPNYVWQGPNSYTATGANPTVTIANALSVGVYSVIGTAVNTCTGSSTATLGTIPLPTVVATGSIGNCLNEPFTFTATGAQSYAWTGPSGYTATGANPFVAITNSLSTGVYTVVGKALNTCTNITTASLTSIPLPTITTISQTVCLNSAATLTANGASTYVWKGPAAYISANQNAFIPAATSAAAQIYTVVGTAINTCTNINTATLTTMPLPTVVTTGTIICYGEPYTIAVTSCTNYVWTGPNSYTANGPGGAFIPVVDLTSTGIYSVLGTAANSCTGAATAAVGTLPLPVVTAAGTLICLNEPFTLTAGGAQSYLWSGPSAYSASGPSAYVPTVNNLSTGVYTVLGTAPNTCTSIATTTLSSIPLPVITTTGALVCINSPTILSAGGAASYSWRGPGSYTASGQNAFIQAATSPAAQVYTVVGLAPTTCTNINTVTLLTIPLPNVTATGTVICYGEPFTIVASGASTYTWNGPNNYNVTGQGAYVPVSNFTSSGTYSVIGTAATGCTNSATAALATMTLPIITATGTSVCFLDPATLKAGGAINGGYTWKGPNSYTANTQNIYIPVADSHLPQTYTVVGIGPNTCTNSNTAVLNTYYLPLPGYNITSTVCFGSYASIEAFGAQTYTWNGPRHYYSTLQNISFPTFNMGQSGSYTLSVTDSLGCKNDTTAFLFISPKPSGTLISDNANNYCVPFCSNFTLKRNSASPIVTTTWNIHESTIASESFKYCSTSAGIDSISGTFIDELGCATTIPFVIQTHPKPKASFVYSPDRPQENADEVLFTNTSQGEQLVKWDWYFSDDRSFTWSAKNANYMFKSGGEYEAAMVVTNTWGCRDTAVKGINVNSDVKFYVPNVFTPNGDGINDTFQPKGVGIEKYEMSIYNRWGDELFQTTRFEQGWDGKAGGSQCRQDVYIWRIHTIDINGATNELTGSVTLMH